MDFAFTDEQAMIADTARAFFAENATSERTRRAMAADGIDRELWGAFCQELGFAGVGIAEEFGGAGLGMVEFACIAEAAGTHVAALPLLGLATAARGIAAGGTAAQREKWLPRILSGDAIAANAGKWHVERQGNYLSGSFDFTPHGNIADVFVVSATGGSWLIERDAAGLKIEAPVTMDQTRPLAALHMDKVLGEPLADHLGAVKAMHAGGWICLAAEALGGAQACLDRTVAYAKERVQFGRPIGSFQAYKHRLADMMVEIEQARSAVYWAACAVDEASDEAPLALHAAKSFCADAFFKCAGDMVQLHGGIGFTWEHDAHLYFKRARSIQTLRAPGNWHREEIAKIILGDAA